MLLSADRACRYLEFLTFITCVAYMHIFSVRILENKEQGHMQWCHSVISVMIYNDFLKGICHQLWLLYAPQTSKKSYSDCALFVCLFVQAAAVGDDFAYCN